MSTPIKKHDYIAISEVSPKENSVITSMDTKDLNFKATELRLGLPGSESPQREEVECNNVVVLEPQDKNVLLLKNFPSGAKRVFSETWVGSEVELCKGGVFSKILGGGVCCESAISSQKCGVGPNAVKEAAPESPRPVVEKKGVVSSANGHGVSPAAKAQVVGWPPVRSFRKNMVSNPPKTEEDANGLAAGCHYVKVSMDGAPYLRKVDLTIHNGYKDLSSALQKMFRCFKAGECGTQGISTSDGLNESKLVDLLHGSEYVLTYEDKDGDWMLVGDVPWEMFTESCKKLRIMKSSEAIGLAPRTMEKCKNH